MPPEGTVRHPSAPTTNKAPASTVALARNLRGSAGVRAPIDSLKSNEILTKAEAPAARMPGDGSTIVHGASTQWTFEESRACGMLSKSSLSRRDARQRTS